jgi:Tol biopolymer transport system component
MGRISALAVVVLLAVPGAARAAFPGANGRIAFDYSDESGHQVRSSTIDGRRVRVLITMKPLPGPLSNQDGIAIWSPSGRRLVFQQAGRGIRSMDARGRHRRHVTAALLWPGFSANGREIVGADNDRSPELLARVRVDGAHLRPVRAPVDSVAWPRWSPTGAWIAYQDDTNGDIWRSRPDGRRARRLASGQLPTWSPDGRRIAFRAGPDIRSIRPDGSGLRTLVRGPRDSSIAGLAHSPDGRRIAYIRQYPADAHDRSVMCTAPARGGRERERFQSDHVMGSVDWQPLPRR